MIWHQIWDTSFSPTATEVCILIVETTGPVDVGRVIGSKERVDAPHRDGSWLPLPSAHWPCIRGSGFMSYMHSIHFPDSLVTTKSRVEKERDRRAMEATGHLAFLLWSSHYWQMNLHCSSPCQTLSS